MGLFLQVPLIFLLYSSSCPQAKAWCYFGMIGNSCGLCTPPAYPDCSVLCALVDKIGDGSCDLWQVNTEECGWDGEDCINPNYPECKGADIDLLANGVCDNASPLNTAACNFDGDDCTVFNLQYPDCNVTDTALIGDGVCNGGEYDTEACAWDGGDCTEETREPVVDDAPTQKGTKYVNGKRHAGSIFLILVILSGVVALFVFTGKKMVKRAQESAFVPVEDQIFPIEIPVAVADREIC